MTRLIVPLLFGVLGTAILLSLGVWQVQRLAWKEGVLNQIEARISADPVALPRTPNSDADQYLPVSLTARFTGEGLDVLVSRKQIGAGFRVIAVARTQDGRRVLVDRGFMRYEDREGATRIGPEAGDVTLYGNLLWPDEVDGFTPAPDTKTGIWFARDLPAMAQELGTEPLLIVQWASSLEDPKVEAMPVQISGIPNDHLGYALQWFALALVWAGMTGYFIYSRRRKS